MIICAPKGALLYKVSIITNPNGYSSLSLVKGNKSNCVAEIAPATEPPKTETPLQPDSDVDSTKKLIEECKRLAAEAAALNDKQAYKYTPQPDRFSGMSINQLLKPYDENLMPVPSELGKKAKGSATANFYSKSN